MHRIMSQEHAGGRPEGWKTQQKMLPVFGFKCGIGCVHGICMGAHAHNVPDEMVQETVNLREERGSAQHPCSKSIEWTEDMTFAWG